MNFEKIKWRAKALSKIRKGKWYYPVIRRIAVYEQQVIKGWDHTITNARQKHKIEYEQSCVSYEGAREDFDNAVYKTEQTLQGCKNLGCVVTTLTFDQFYSFWSINPYRWHCRDLFVYTKDEENKKMFVQFKTKTDLHTYIGWREEIRETYEKQALIEEHSKNTIALLKEVQRDINDTNDKAIKYYEQAVEYLGEDDNE